MSYAAPAARKVTRQNAREGNFGGPMADSKPEWCENAGRALRGAQSMKTSRSTAERIRPILQAMERSIESARLRRLNKSHDPTTTRALESGEPLSEDGQRPRRKARPKRPSAMLPQYRGPEYQAPAV